MKVINILFVILLFGILSACGGREGSTTAIRGSAEASLQSTDPAAVDGIVLSAAETSLDLRISGGKQQRVFNLLLPDGSAVTNWSWSQQPEDVLCVVEPVDGGAEIAVLPLGQAAAPELNLSLVLGQTPSRSASQSMGESRGIVRNLRFGGQVTTSLEWQQMLPGDYNFDGSVNLADLQALAAWWGQDINRDGPGSENTTGYWMDGNADGRINHLDSQLTLQFYGLQIMGYAVRRNQVNIQGNNVNEIVVPQSEGVVRKGLPKSFSLEVQASPSDNWYVVPISLHGSCGGGGMTGGGKLIISVQFEGELAPIDNADEPRFGTRVIDPVEFIDSIELPVNVVAEGSTVEINDVPVSRNLFTEINYIPGGNFNMPVRATSATGEELAQPIRTAIACCVPANGSVVRIDVLIRLERAGNGGLLITLQTATAVNDGPRVNSRAQLDYLAGELRRDTDADGILQDELAFTDSDRNLLSDSLTWEIRNFPVMAQGLPALKLRGTISTVDAAAGWINLTNVVAASGVAPTPVMRIQLAENSLFGIGCTPQQLVSGRRIYACLHPCDSYGGQHAYLASFIELVDSSVTLPAVNPYLLYNFGSLNPRWVNPAQMHGNHLSRYSGLYVPRGPGNPYQFSVPGLRLNWSQGVPLSDSYSDSSITAGATYVYDIYAQRKGEQLVHLGSTR